MINNVQGRHACTPICYNHEQTNALLSNKPGKVRQSSILAWLLMNFFCMLQTWASGAKSNLHFSLAADEFVKFEQVVLNLTSILA